MDKETILIIDDESSFRESLSFYFQDEGYCVFTAENGRTGLEKFFNERVDIVITDLRMPEKDGIEVMKLLGERSPETPLVVVSGAGEREDIIKALRMGAKDYITKPINDLEMVRHVIRKALETKYLTQENIRYRVELEKSEARYRTISEQIAEGVFTMDSLGNITFTNHAFRHMLGYGSKALDLMNPLNLKNLTTQESFRRIKQQKQALGKGLTQRIEIQMVDHQKKILDVELACSPILDDKNCYNGAVVVVRDITKRIELQKLYQKFLKDQGNRSKEILAICASCKSVRDRKAGWVPVEDFFKEIVFSHGICPVCCEKLYPHIDLSHVED